MGQLTVPSGAKKARIGGDSQAPAIVPADTGPLPGSQTDGRASGFFLPAPPPGLSAHAGGLSCPAAPPVVAPEAAGLKAEPAPSQHAGSVRSRGSQPVPLPPATQPQHTWAAKVVCGGQRTEQGRPQASAPLPIQRGIPPHGSVSAAKHDAQQGHSGSFMAGLRADLGASRPMRERLPVSQQLPASVAALPAYGKPAVADLPTYHWRAVPSQAQQPAQMNYVPPLPQLSAYRHSDIGALPPGAVLLPGVLEVPRNPSQHRQMGASQPHQAAYDIEAAHRLQQAAATRSQHGRRAASTAPSGASVQPGRNIVRLPGSHAQVAAIRDANGFLPRLQQSRVKACRH